MQKYSSICQRPHCTKGCVGCLSIVLIAILTLIGIITFPHDKMVCIEYIDEHRELITVSQNGIIGIYSSGIEKERYHTRLKNPVKFVTKALNKKVFAIVDHNDNVNIFDTKTLNLSTIESHPEDLVTDVIFSRDSEAFCIFNKHKITVYQTVPREKLFELTMESDVCRGAFCYDDTQLWILTQTSSSGKRKLRIYSLSESKHTANLLTTYPISMPDSPYPYFNIVVSGREGIPLVLWDKTIYWYTDDHTSLASMNIDEPIKTAVTHVGDSSVIIETHVYRQEESGCRNIYRWDAKECEIHTCGSFLPYRDDSQSLVYLPKRQAVLYTYIRMIRILHLQSGKEETIPLSESQRNHDAFYPFCISDDERFMAYFYQNRTFDKRVGIAEMSIAQDLNVHDKKSR